MTTLLLMDELEERGLATLGSQKKGLSSPDSRHKRGDSEDPYRAFHIVGKYVQTHLGTDARNRLGEKVRRPHPGFDRAKRMFDGLPAYS